jgi:MFS family permease
VHQPLNPSPADEAPDVLADRPSMFHALSYRNYRLLWITNLFSSGGNWIQQVTIGWLAFDVTESPFKVAMVMGMRAIPMLAAPLSGLLADRFDRRRIMIIDHFGLMVIALCFALIVLFDVLQEWHLYVFSFLTGVAWSINNPIRQVLVGNTVPRSVLMNAVALNSLGFNTMRMIGPAFGGAMIVAFGPGVNFLLQGFLYVGVLAALVPFRADYASAAPKGPRGSILKELGEGFRYIGQSAVTLTAILLSLVTTFTTMAFISTQAPVFAALVIGDDSGGALGWMLTAMGGGGFVGTVLIARFSNFQRKGLLVMVSVAGAGIMLIVMAQVETLLLTMGLIAVQQIFFNTVMITNNTIVQSITVDEMRGRVMGVYMLDIGFQPLGGVIAGILASIYSVSVSWMIGGTACLVSLVVISAFAGPFRRLRI